MRCFFMLHVLNSLFRSHSDPDLALQLVVARLYDCRHSYIFVLQACFQFLRGVAATIGCPLFSLLLRWLLPLFIDTLQITWYSVGTSARSYANHEKTCTQRLCCFKTVSVLKDLGGPPANWSVEQCRKKRAVHVFKANNKFLLITFDNLVSDFIWLRIQTKSEEFWKQVKGR